MASAIDLPKTPRQPDGVILDPEPTVPRAVESAPARGVISLKEPLSDAILRGAVDAFFVPFTSHDPDALEGVLSRAARLLDSHGASSFTVVRDELVRRVAAFKAAGVTRVDVDGIERFDYGDLAQNGAHPRPPEMRKGDVLVRVHVSLPRLSGDRLFADIVVLVFRWDEEADGPGKARLKVVGFDEQEAR
jgi:hypothetical protein